ncbi:hypothetical protein Tco_0716817 [Tanacetum coccineum]
MVLRVKRKLFVIEQPISLASPTDSEYLRIGMRYMIHNKVACLMLGIEGLYFDPSGYAWRYTYAYIQDGVTFIAKSPSFFPRHFEGVRRLAAPSILMEEEMETQKKKAAAYCDENVEP